MANVLNEPITDSKAAAAAVSAPTSGATVVTLGVLPAGTYKVHVTATNAGTQETTTAGLQAMILRKGTTTISALPTTSGIVRQDYERITVDGTQSINVATATAAIAGSIYIASLSAVLVGA